MPDERSIIGTGSGIRNGREQERGAEHKDSKAKSAV
jgi:hypothetical protein